MSKTAPTHARSRNKEVALLGITEKNIVPSASYNFLFGLAYLGHPAATASIHPLDLDAPPDALLAERLAKIALHELGHSFGLDHHAYEEDIDCLMVGDTEVDCIGEVDSGSIQFCERCWTSIRKHLNLRRKTGTPSTA